MQLKKIIAGVVASAIAVTSVTITSLIVSAADSTEPIKISLSNNVIDSTHTSDIVVPTGSLTLSDVKKIVAEVQSDGGGTIGANIDSTWTDAGSLSGATWTWELSGVLTSEPHIQKWWGESITVSSVKFYGTSDALLAVAELDTSLKNIEIPFEEKDYPLSVIDASSWGNGFTKAAQLNHSLTEVEGITFGSTTYADLKKSVYSLTGVDWSAYDLPEGVEASNIGVNLYAVFTDPSWYNQYSATMNFTAATDISDDAVIQELGIQFNINGNVAGIDDMTLGDTVVLSLANAETTPAETTPAETTPAETTPAETTPAETTPAETTPAETTPAETTSAETTPAETTPAETTPAETTSAETTPAETTPAETTPAETTPAETTPAETTPAETTPAETTPAETTPAETTPAETTPAETEPDTTEPDVTEPEPAEPDDLLPPVDWSTPNEIFNQEALKNVSTYDKLYNGELEITYTFSVVPNHEWTNGKLVIRPQYDNGDLGWTDMDFGGTGSASQDWFPEAGYVIADDAETFDIVVKIDMTGMIGLVVCAQSGNPGDEPNGNFKLVSVSMKNEAGFAATYAGGRVTEPKDPEKPDVTEPEETTPPVTEPSDPIYTWPAQSEAPTTTAAETEAPETTPAETEAPTTVPSETEPDITEPAGTTRPDVVIPGTSEIIEGSDEGSADVAKDNAFKIEIPELNVTIEANAGTFEENVSKIIAEVTVKLADASESEKAAVIAAAIEGLANASESVSVNDVISVTLKDQDGNTVQPVNGATVKVTLPYDGKSNYAVYIDGTVPEFIKLTIADGYASFEAKHFSDYYLVTLSDEAINALEGGNAAGDPTKPTDDKNQPTGFAIALIPAAATAIVVVVSKKKK